MTKKVTVDDLRQAICAYEALAADAGGQMSLCQSKRADAWRTAFEWLHHGEGVARCGDSYVVGLMLIEEKLR